MQGLALHQIDSYFVKKDSSDQKRDVIQQLYEIYTAPNSQKHLKISNLNRYTAFLLKQEIVPTKAHIHDQINLVAFKKSKDFLTQRNKISFAIALKKHNIEVLYEILSIAKDKENRSENSGAYISSQFWKYIKTTN